MPKFPKTFGRRKSTANQLEEESSTSEHSFKVFERPEGEGRSFDGGVKFAKSKASTTQRLHVEDDNIFDQTTNNRTSGASNLNSISTANNSSSRSSAASTTPSSIEPAGNSEWRSPHDKPFHDIPLPPLPRSSPGFTLKNAGRAMSWGRNKTPPIDKEWKPPPVPKDSNEDDLDSGRTRAVTTSSYASTAAPPKLTDSDLGLNLEGNFSDMFSGFDKRNSKVLGQDASRGLTQSPDNLVIAPQAPSNGRTNHLSPLTIDKGKQIETAPYSWSSQHSRKGLMSGISPPPFAPKDVPPPVPKHGVARPTTAGPASFTRQQNIGGPVEGHLNRGSGPSYGRQSTSEYRESIDEDVALLRESLTASRRMDEPGFSSKVRDSWALPSSSSYQRDNSPVASRETGSVQTTPRATKAEPNQDEENIFDEQISESANLAMRFEEKAQSSPSAASQGPIPRVMTPAQFERYKQDQERLRSIGGKPIQDEDDNEGDETYEDVEDDAEKAKQIAKQRRKQEAHMAVYRQQMRKVTGEAPTSLLRPGVMASQSSPNLGKLGTPEDDEEEDEEVPLAILQAHGFPSKTKPPMKSMGSNPNLRSAAGSTAGGVVDPRLPVFARKLPQDPYYGAGIVNPIHRESLAFGVGTASLNGGSSRTLPPGGLVGVIATEERSRALRRGSPNAHGEYGPPPPSGFNGMGLGPNIQVSGPGSMYNGYGGNPMAQMGGVNSMMMTPGDQAQMQITQQMQQFMQMQMQFMQVMTTQGQTLPAGHMSHQSMQVPRPDSSQGLQPGGSHQRAATMMDMGQGPWNQQRSSTWAPSTHGGNGYAPSIAPSERSNIGLPGRYRPVSQMPVSDLKSRTSTMSGRLENWDVKKTTATIKPVKNTNCVEDEDDEAGWAEMVKQREQKKSLWRTKKDKDSNGLKEMLGYLN